MIVAITAVTGHLGAEIVKATVSLLDGEHVIGIARDPTKGENLAVEIRRGDYNSRGEFENALRGVDSLLLVSGRDEPDRRVEQHRNVIGAAVAAGVKKIVYTSVQGAEEGTTFSPIISSNRQTEEDVRTSGLCWTIGRNGIYVEPDVEYIDKYREKGEIVNCAGDGRCGYTTRPELAYAYACLLTDSSHDGKTYNLHGEAITQAELAGYLNDAFGAHLEYRSISVAEYRRERVAELGEFLGNVITGIYEGIRIGHADNRSDYATAAGRPHQTWDDYFAGVNANRPRPG